MREIRPYDSEGSGEVKLSLPLSPNHGFLIFVSSLLRTFTVSDMMRR